MVAYTYFAAHTKKKDCFLFRRATMEVVMFSRSLSLLEPMDWIPSRQSKWPAATFPAWRPRGIEIARQVMIRKNAAHANYEDFHQASQLFAGLNFQHQHNFNVVLRI